MVKRSPSNHDSFYGCSNFRTSSCDGKRDLDFNELNNKYEIVKKEGDDFLRYSDKDRILRYVEKNNGQCRISELNKYLKDMNFNSVNMTRAFVESNLNHELIVDKDKHGGAIVKKK